MATQNPKALLKRLLEEKREQPWLEFKTNTWDVEAVGRCLSACANASILTGRDRAFMVWGIEDKTKKKVGTRIQLNEQKKGSDGFVNWISRLIEPHLFMEFLDFEDEGLNFAIIVIEPTYDRPVRFAGSEYIRIGEHIKALRDFPEHERALWFATGRYKFESAIALSHQSSGDIIAKLDVDSYFKLAALEAPKSRPEMMRRLCEREFIKDDLEGGYDVLNLGALLFAKDIRSFPSIAMKSVRVIKYTTVDKSQSEGEMEGQRGYAVGFQGLVKYIMECLPKIEKYTNGVRSVSSTYSNTAIREMVANALIHQDLAISGSGPMVEIYKDRVEVVNPGNSLIIRDRMIDERKSRNEKLAKTMRDLGFCEERGGGIDKAILEIEEMSLPAPLFFASENSMRVVLFGPKKFGELSKSDKVWACFCHCVVRWLRHDYMSNTTLRARFSLTDGEYQTISSLISDTKKEGKIRLADQAQSGRYARYVPYWAGANNDE